MILKHYSKQVELSSGRRSRNPSGLYPPAEERGAVIKTGILWGHGADSPAGAAALPLRFLPPQGEIERSCGGLRISMSTVRPLTCCELENAGETASLHNQITACDAVLEVSNHALGALIS